MEASLFLLYDSSECLGGLRHSVSGTSIYGFLPSEGSRRPEVDETAFGRMVKILKKVAVFKQTMLLAGGQDGPLCRINSTISFVDLFLLSTGLDPALSSITSIG